MHYLGSKLETLSSRLKNRQIIGIYSQHVYTISDLDGFFAYGTLVALAVTRSMPNRSGVLNSLRPQPMAAMSNWWTIIAYVNMTGACNGCQMASMTISGMQQRLMEVLGELGWA